MGSRRSNRRKSVKNTRTTLSPTIMSKPPLFPDKTASGIAIDPRTLDRVIPESRRADGSYATRSIYLRLRRID